MIADVSETGHCIRKTELDVLLCYWNIRRTFYLTWNYQRRVYSELIFEAFAIQFASRFASQNIYLTYNFLKHLNHCKKTLQSSKVLVPETATLNGFLQRFVYSTTFDLKGLDKLLCTCSWISKLPVLERWCFYKRSTNIRERLDGNICLKNMNSLELSIENLFYTRSHIFPFNNSKVQFHNILIVKSLIEK